MTILSLPISQATNSIENSQLDVSGLAPDKRDNRDDVAFRIDDYLGLDYVSFHSYERIDASHPVLAKCGDEECHRFLGCCFGRRWL
jgi:hypothetical protein